MFILKKFVKNLYKSFVQLIFKAIYGKIYLANDNEINDCQIVKSIRISNCEYKVFKVKQGRLFTTSIHDTAIIFKNKLVPQPSFQLRVKDGDKNYARNNSDIKDNITLKIGTPRILKKLKGKVFSLLSGGAAKTNYFHWLFEVLPRIEILKKCEEIENINFFLLPSIKMEHQLVTLELLGLSKKKFLDSNSFKHILSDELYIVDHPFRLTNNTVYDTQNIPFWIFAWIRNKFLKFSYDEKGIFSIPQTSDIIFTQGDNNEMLVPIKESKLLPHSAARVTKVPGLPQHLSFYFSWIDCAFCEFERSSRSTNKKLMPSISLYTDIYYT